MIHNDNERAFRDASVRARLLDVSGRPLYHHRHRGQRRVRWYRHEPRRR